MTSYQVNFSATLQRSEGGELLTPDGELIVYRYDDGDVDTIDANEPDLDKLHHALYDARECGEVPNVRVFILPNGGNITLD